ncbi:MAG: sulfotransferase domain-containing protein [Chloroflexi bacterium]|nr:sulfotransferase domain-containing protein [Chloroflexota bacterium]
MIQPYYDLKAWAIRQIFDKRGTECYILSYPKCGRTWLRLLIGKVMCDQFNQPEEKIIGTYRLTAVPGVLRTHFSHDYSSIKESFPYNRMPQDKSQYAPAKVIFLIRDIRDTLVSSYFQATKRVNRFHGPLSDFLRSDKYGVRKIVTYYNLWYENQNVPRDFLLLRYEDLHQNPTAVLRQTLQFMEMAEVREDLLTAAVHYASFDNMKKMESKGALDTDKMQPGQQADNESYKVRKGVVGGYGEYLSADDLAYIDAVIQEVGCPFAELYAPSK